MDYTKAIEEIKMKRRQGLVKRYGEEFVLRLEEEAEQKTKKWSRDELEIIIETYK